jgi:TolA-binding protein
MQTPDFIYGIACVVAAVAVFLFLLYRSLKKTDEPLALINKWIWTFLIAAVGIFLAMHSPLYAVPPVVALFAIPIGAIWTKSLGAIVAAPLTGLFTGGNREVDPTPIYSIAESKRGHGQYDEAIRLIRAELEKFPGDFVGMMLLATIQAENLNDIQAAQATIEQLLAVPKRTPQAIASALHALADWQLRLPDPDAARAALQRIIDQFPDTPLAQIAMQRIARIGSVDQIAAMRERGPIALPAGKKDIGLRTDIVPVPEENPMDTAAAYTRQLTKHPADAETREKLALLYMNEFHRPDLAAQQFQLLSCQANMPARRAAGWLNQLASIHLQNNDLTAARAAVNAIIERYPGTAPAEMAKTRLPGLEGELKGYRNAQSVKLGSYESDLGLKPTTSE